MLKRVSLLLISSLCSSLFFATSSSAADSLVNGNFSNTGGGWIGASFTGSGNAACPNGEPNVGTWSPNELSFSYIKTTVYQDVVISKPSSVTLTFTVRNRGDQVYTQWFSADLGSVSTGNFTPSTTNTTYKLTITTKKAAQVVRVSFTGQDQLFWAGCYGSHVSNASLSVTPLDSSIPLFESYLQQDLVQTTKAELVRYGENYICRGGEYGYRNIREPKSIPVKQALDSLTLVLYFDGKPGAYASSDDFKLLPKWIFGLSNQEISANVIGSSAAWSIPDTASIKNISCRVTAYKGNQVTFTKLLIE